MCLNQFFLFFHCDRLIQIYSLKVFESIISTRYKKRDAEPRLSQVFTQRLEESGTNGLFFPLRTTYEN